MNTNKGGHNQAGNWRAWWVVLLVNLSIWFHDHVSTFCQLLVSG